MPEAGGRSKGNGTASGPVGRGLCVSVSFGDREEEVSNHGEHGEGKKGTGGHGLRVSLPLVVKVRPEYGFSAVNLPKSQIAALRSQ